MYVYLIIAFDGTVLLTFDKEEHALDTIKDSFGPVSIRRYDNGSLRVDTENFYFSIERHLRLCGPSRL